MSIRATNMSIRDSIMPFRAFVMTFHTGKNVGNEEMWILVYDTVLISVICATYFFRH
jgi:hypothetical protein